MRPTIAQQLIQARLADLPHQAQRGALARAARRARAGMHRRARSSRAAPGRRSGR
jgi:hypothetical protein